MSCGFCNQFPHLLQRKVGLNILGELLVVFLHHPNQVVSVPQLDFLRIVVMLLFRRQL